jgi:hypothetical protein
MKDESASFNGYNTVCNCRIGEDDDNALQPTATMAKKTIANTRILKQCSSHTHNQKEKQLRPEYYRTDQSFAPAPNTFRFQPFTITIGTSISFDWRALLLLSKEKRTFRASPLIRHMAPHAACSILAQEK